MPGHGGAGNLPSDRYTPCNCPDDNRRVITIRIDGSWDVDPNGNATPGNTNLNVWNAAVCSANQWNTAQDPWGNKTGYYFVIDQSGQFGSPDITITNRQPAASGYASLNRAYPYSMSLSPSNGNLNGGQFTSQDLCGRIGHELGHTIGLGGVQTACASIMRGVNNNGTRPVNQVGPTDVLQVNNNLRDDMRGNCAASVLTDPGEEEDDIGGGGGGGCETIDADGDGWNSCVDCNDNQYDPSNNCDPGDPGSGCYPDPCGCYYSYGYVYYSNANECWDKYYVEQYICDGQVMWQSYTYEGEYCEYL